jgi:hypothetical protein
MNVFCGSSLTVVRDHRRRQLVPCPTASGDGRQWPAQCFPVMVGLPWKRNFLPPTTHFDGGLRRLSIRRPRPALVGLDLRHPLGCASPKRRSTTCRPTRQLARAEITQALEDRSDCLVWSLTGGSPRSRNARPVIDVRDSSYPLRDNMPDNFTIRPLILVVCIPWLLRIMGCPNSAHIDGILAPGAIE